MFCPLQGDNALQFLSREEQECLQFFEETIESLEEGLDEEQQRQRRHLELNSRPVKQFDGLPTNRDIIDLVHSEPDLVHAKEPIFSPTQPGTMHHGF